MYHLLTLPVVDFFGYGISKFVYPDEPVHHNRRWFLVHTYINTLATIYNFHDTYLCFSNPMLYPALPMSAGSFFATDMVVWGHLYHILVFYPYLKPNEWFHHIIMMSINGVSVYFLHNKAQAASAFFLCGLPGMIDYFLLWCVKMKFLEPKIEKLVYLFITTYIRSPGAVIVSYASIPYLMNCPTWGMTLYGSLLVGLNFWNGQYYMMRSCIDYGSYIK